MPDRAQPWQSLRLAAGTLTVLPVAARGPAAVEHMRASTAWYPLVGLGVGALPALALSLALPPLPRAVLALALWVVVTGALHLDGWADCCDAAFAPARATAAETHARRHAILKDPHLGTFGAAGLVLLLLGKWAALLHAPAAAPLLAAPVARWGMVLALRLHPPARPHGLGATLAGRVPLAGATLVLLTAVLPLLPVTGSAWRAVASVAAGMVTAWAVAAWLSARFGGITGDVCGGAAEAAELAALWVWLG